jgi:cation:H+ antiporter
MALTVGLLALGAVVLYAGASVAVRGATTLARAVGISSSVLGAVLFGIDVEGLGTAVTAAAMERTEIAGGVAFGSVLFLFTAAFGLALVVSRRPVRSPATTMVTAPALGVAAAALAISDRFVSRREGLLLVALYAGYVFLVTRDDRRVRERADDLPEATEPPAEEEVEMAEGAAEEPARPSRARAGVLLVSGLVFLYLGAALLVTGGVRLVGHTQLLAGFIGAAIIGALSTFDEFLLGFLPGRRGDPELAVGNLFGTLGAFTTGVLGVAAVVRPLSLDAGVTVSFLAAAFVYAVVATTFFVRGEAGRGLGVFLLASYVAWLLVGVTI